MSVWEGRSVVMRVVGIQRSYRRKKIKFKLLFLLHDISVLIARHLISMTLRKKYGNCELLCVACCSLFVRHVSVWQRWLCHGVALWRHQWLSGCFRWTRLRYRHLWYSYYNSRTYNTIPIASECSALNLTHDISWPAEFHNVISHCAAEF